MNFALALYVLFPFLAEASARLFQSILTFNYFAISFGVAAIHLIPFFSFPKLKKVWIWWYFLVFYIPTLIDVCHIYFFNGSIDMLALRAVFETNFNEAKEFVIHLSNAKSLTFVSILLLSSFFLLKNMLSEKVKREDRPALFLIFVIGLIASLRVCDKYKPTVVRIIKSYGYYTQEKEFAIKCFSQRKSFDYGQIQSLVFDKGNKTYVVVIGESATRGHLGLYGYGRDTTPKLNEIKQDLYIFDKVTSAHCQTFAVLQEALTFDNFAQGDVISFFQKAGFKTFWLSNQFGGGEWNNIVAIIGNQADVSFFVSQRETKATGGLYFDELLIKPFKKALKDPAPKKIIFVHLLGSHSGYDNRYPTKFDIFRDDSSKINQTVCEYDNSIAYTDFILWRLISLLKEKNENSYLLYLSDHGEDVRESPDCSFSHSPSISHPLMFSIPFFVWVSERYLNENSEFVKNWDRHKEYRTDKLIHSILRLSRLQNHKINVRYSIFD